MAFDKKFLVATDISRHLDVKKASYAVVIYEGDVLVDEFVGKLDYNEDTVTLELIAINLGLERVKTKFPAITKLEAQTDSKQGFRFLKGEWTIKRSAPHAGRYAKRMVRFHQLSRTFVDFDLIHVNKDTTKPIRRADRLARSYFDETVKISDSDSDSDSGSDSGSDGGDEDERQQTATDDKDESEFQCYSTRLTSAIINGMDEPIVYPLYMHCCKQPRENKGTLFQRFYFTTRADDKEEFLRLIKHPRIEEVRDVLVGKIFQNDAVEIATALFNGEMKGVIDLEDELKDGMTALHLAAFYRAPRLTKYLLERGDNVDVMCDCGFLNLKQVTPIDLALEGLRYKGPHKSLFEVLWRLCYHHTDCLEVLRMLVQNTQNREHVRQAFIKYAHKGDVSQVAGLFLAVPELLLSPPEGWCGLSSISQLYHELSYSSRTYIEEELSLLLDVLSTVGDKLVAYIRLPKTYEQLELQNHERIGLEIDFFIREVACKKLGVSSPDYYFRFHKPMKQEAGHEVYENLKDENGDLAISEWDECATGFEGNDIFNSLPYLLLRKDCDETDLYRLVPSLYREDADGLNNALKNKLAAMSSKQSIDMMLSLMSIWHGFREQTNAQVSKKVENHIPLGFQFSGGRSRLEPHTFMASGKPCFVPNLRSFSTCVTSPSSSPILDSKFGPAKCWENKLMKATKLKSFFPVVKRFPVIAKRLIK